MHHSSPQKILFSATVYNHLLVFHLPLIKLMQQKGFEVWAAAGQMAEHPNDRAMLEKNEVICVDISFSRNPLHWNNLTAMYELSRLFNQEYFDILHFHTPVAAFIGRFIAKYHHQGVKFYTAHGYHFYKGASWFSWLLYYPLERLSASWTDKMIVTNHEDYIQAEKMGFMAERDLFLIPGVGVEIEKLHQAPLSPIKNDLGLNDSDLLVVYIAELNDNKNHIFLLNNWNEIIKAVPFAQLLIIGTGENEPYLKQLVSDSKLQNIHFLGYRNDVANLLAVTDIVTLLSIREGLPKSLLEAMSAGKPCIVSNIRGSRELITSGVNGFVVELNDSHGLQKAFIDLLTHDEKRAKFGLESAQKVQEFALQKVLDKMSTLYQQALTD